MHRTNVLELVVNNEQKKLLLEMMTLSSCVWNQANYNFRQAIVKREKINSFFDQQKALQNTDNYKKLGRSYAKPMLLKHSFLVNSFFGLIKLGEQEEVGLPKYFKNRKTNTTLPSFLTMESAAYCFRKEKIQIPLSRKMRKETGLKGLFLGYKGKPKWKGKQRSAEIHYNAVRKKFYLHQAVEIKEPKMRTGRKTLAIDIGIKFGIAGFDNNKSYLYPSPIIKKWKQIAKRISRLKRIAMTRNGVRSSNQIRRLYAKQKTLVDNYYKNIVSWCIKDSNPDKIIVGDVKDILEKKCNYKTKNQSTHNLWSFDVLYKRLQNKCEEKGIEFIRVPEPFTSQICPSCGSFNLPYDREYNCGNCGYEQHRDTVGSMNIYYQNIGGKICLNPTLENKRLLVRGLDDKSDCPRSKNPAIAGNSNVQYLLKKNLTGHCYNKK